VTKGAVVDCKDFIRGYCPRGLVCKFFHDQRKADDFKAEQERKAIEIERAVAEKRRASEASRDPKRQQRQHCQIIMLVDTEPVKCVVFR
jgi:hypothetical protein